jgi:primosomal protein N' (replication factor Y)
MTPGRIARVALPLPVARPYRYAVPTTLADRALPGARVVVPVREREMVGVVVALEQPGDTAGLRALLAAPDEPVALTPPLLALAATAARHWGAPVGLMLRAMLPAALWGRSVVQLSLLPDAPWGLGGTAGALLRWLHDRPGQRATTAQAGRALKRAVWDVVDRLQRIGAIALDTIPADAGGGASHARVAALTGEAIPLVERDALWRRAPARRRLYEALESGGGRVTVPDLLARADAGRAALDALVQHGLVTIDEEPVTRDPFAGLPVTPPPEHLTAAQAAALAQLDTVAPGEPALLFGVTGSGKTAVYLERIRAGLARGEGAILLVPEIALTPQTVARVRGAFGDTVAVLHSGLTDLERADAWRALRRGERRVAVGARSAVFAPIERLGVIVLDEEHEATYKNGETPRYHARDVAAMRGRLEGARVILGSATPALESWHRAAAHGAMVRLPERIGARPLPPVELVDLRAAPSLAGGDLPWSPRLDALVERALARTEQVLLLLNRRGWSSFLQCDDCGAAVECPDCSVAMTWHHHPDHLRCHYCGRRDEPSACVRCGGATAQHRGAGTQRLERWLAERFPRARLARMDLDTTASRWAHHRILERVDRGEVDILLGTQMIAKGIDFPRVTAVGVVDADLALHLPDFRAAERCFQLVAQVAGRAGRGPAGGTVVVQTRDPRHPALLFAAAHDAAGFLAAELEARQSPAYPPHVSLARVVASHEDEPRTIARITALAEWSERAIARSALRLLVLGPAPCPVARIRGAWRWHLLLKGPPEAIDAWVRTVGPRLGPRAGDVRLTVDRDPVALL